MSRERNIAGFSLTEAVIGVAIIAAISAAMFFFLNSTRQQMTNLTTSAACQQTVNTMMTSLSSWQNTRVIRNWMPQITNPHEKRFGSTAAAFSVVNPTEKDPFCNASYGNFRNSLLCDTHDLITYDNAGYLVADGPPADPTSHFVVNLHENVRSLSTWAAALYNNRITALGNAANSDICDPNGEGMTLTPAQFVSLHPTVSYTIPSSVSQVNLRILPTLNGASIPCGTFINNRPMANSNYVLNIELQIIENSVQQRPARCSTKAATTYDLGSFSASGTNDTPYFVGCAAQKIDRNAACVIPGKNHGTSSPRFSYFREDCPGILRTRGPINNVTGDLADTYNSCFGASQTPNQLAPNYRDLLQKKKDCCRESIDDLMTFTKCIGPTGRVVIEATSSEPGTFFVCRNVVSDPPGKFNSCAGKFDIDNKFRLLDIGVPIPPNQYYPYVDACFSSPTRAEWSWSINNSVSYNIEVRPVDVAGNAGPIEKIELGATFCLNPGLCPTPNTICPNTVPDPNGLPGAFCEGTLPSTCDINLSNYCPGPHSRVDSCGRPCPDGTKPPDCADPALYCTTVALPNDSCGRSCGMGIKNCACPSVPIAMGTDNGATGKSFIRLYTDNSRHYCNGCNSTAANITFDVGDIETPWIDANGDRYVDVEMYIRFENNGFNHNGWTPAPPPVCDWTADTYAATYVNGALNCLEYSGVVAQGGKHTVNNDRNATQCTSGGKGGSVRLQRTGSAGCAAIRDTITARAGRLLVPPAGNFGSTYTLTGRICEPTVIVPPICTPSCPPTDTYCAETTISDTGCGGLCPTGTKSAGCAGLPPVIPPTTPPTGCTCSSSRGCGSTVDSCGGNSCAPNTAIPPCSAIPLPGSGCPLQLAYCPNDTGYLDALGNPCPTGAKPSDCPPDTGTYCQTDIRYDSCGRRCADGTMPCPPACPSYSCTNDGDCGLNYCDPYNDCGYRREVCRMATDGCGYCQPSGPLCKCQAPYSYQIQ